MSNGPGNGRKPSTASANSLTQATIVSLSGDIALSGKNTYYHQLRTLKNGGTVEFINVHTATGNQSWWRVNGGPGNAQVNQPRAIDQSLFVRLYPWIHPAVPKTHVIRIVGTAEYHGQPCVRLEWDYDQRIREIILVREFGNLAFIVRRESVWKLSPETNLDNTMVKFPPGSVERSIYETGKLQLTKGIPLPVETRQTNIAPAAWYSALDPTSKLPSDLPPDTQLVEVQRYALSQVEVNTEIPPDQFQLHFLPRTLVRDAKTGRQFLGNGKPYGPPVPNNPDRGSSPGSHR